MRVFILLFLLFLPITSAQLPENLQKIASYNAEQAVHISETFTFLVAFLGGLLSMLSPCTLALLPGFFAYTLKEKKEITKSTLVFGSGFILGFVLLGILAASVGTASLLIFQEDLTSYIQIAGLFLIGLGILRIMGKGLPGIALKSIGKGTLETFGMGFVYTLGWSACSGPILAGILIMASLMRNYISAAFLLFFYGAGILVPLLLTGLLFDKYQFWKSPILKGKMLDFGEIRVHTTDLISGLLLLFMGGLFLFQTNTSIFNQHDTMGIFFVGVLLLLIYAKVKKRFTSIWAIRIFFMGIFLAVAYVGVPAKWISDAALAYVAQHTVLGNLIGGILLLSMGYLLYGYFKNE